jgi:hypothetical protein
MQEQNLTTKETDSQVELRNREFTDLLGDAPTWLLHSGSYFLYGILALFFLGTAFIHYPDVVKGSVYVTDLANVEWVTANSSGYLSSVFVKNNSVIKRGDTIGIIENAARLNDVRILCRSLSNTEKYYLTNNTNLLKTLPFDLIMGEMSEAYKTFTQAVRNCLIHDEYSGYSQRNDFLQKELEILKKEPEKNELSIVKLESEIFELSITNKLAIENNRRQLEVAYEGMVNSIKEWEMKYLICSPRDGRVFMSEEHIYLKQGDTICSVISSNKEDFSARLMLEQDKISEVVVGDKVNIHLVKYPSNTYGILSGEVSAISFIPYNKMFAIDISFPNLLNTSTKRQIKYEPGLRGEAEIITADRSVLSRIFAPVFNQFRKVSETKINNT